MPYIKEKSRNAISSYGEVVINEAGELNYYITTTILKYLERKEHNKQTCYADWNEIMGVLECIKQEIYRRKIAPYEDKKCKENGDVF